MKLTLFRPLCALAVLAGAITVIGCATQQEDPQQAMYERQQKAMKDPLHYSPWTENTDINGGGIGESKGLGKDWNDFWNP